MDQSTEFFQSGIHERGHLLPVGLSGTIRFDLRRGERIDRWYLTLSDGAMDVSQVDDEREAECVVCAEGPAFDRLVAGANPAAAVLRNEVAFRGRLQVFVFFQRLLPGPPGARGPARTATGGARK